MNEPSRKLSRMAALAAVAGVALAAPQAASAQGADRAAEFVPGELLVQFAPGTSRSEGKAIAGRRDARVIEPVGVVPRAALVELPPGLGVRAAERAFEALSEVKRAQPNFLYELDVTPDDQYFGYLWGLHNTGQSILGTAGSPDADIDAPEAWDHPAGPGTTTTGSPDSVVAVIDTGVKPDHLDLDDNLWVNEGEVAGNGRDDDGNAYTDDVNGYDFVNDDPGIDDDHGHGTHVSGTIGAEGNNQIGVAGVNWEVSLMTLKAGGPGGSLATSDVVDATEYAAANGADVINASYSGSSYDWFQYRAIRDAPGILFAAAAGNDALDVDTAPAYPCAFDLANVVCVAAGTQSDGLASFSNYGRSSVDLAAPGVRILSTSMSGGYGWMSGTSMATPHVAGAAALLLDAHPGYAPADLRTALLNTVDQRPAFACAVATGGRLNLNGAIAEGASSAPPPPTASCQTPSQTVNQVTGGGGGPGEVADDDAPRCGGKRATIVGTDRGETIRGTAGPDVIAALAGADKVRGRGGDDRICGEDGKDRLYGGNGKDRLYGGDAKDRLFGGKGKDRLAGGPGKDRQAQ